MKILYIGQYSKGTTSKMRADQISNFFPSAIFNVIDIHIPFYKTNKIFRSIGVRFKKGKLISNINKYIQDNLVSSYDLAWVDKGVFINKTTLKKVRKVTKTLVHFTPDMAFYANKSRFFIDNINFYDFLITTKTAEINEYKKHVDVKKIIVVTQGFDKNIHKPYYTFNEKEDYISFIGLYEKSRDIVVQQIIDSNINIKIAGMGWTKFAERNKNRKNFSYIGKGLFSEDYSKFISKSIMGLGLLSKNFPEFHTTRTFEIPACNTALLTEKNIETKSFFSNDEVIFYESNEQLVERIKYYILHKNELKTISEKGRKKVVKGGYDYQNIIKKALKQAKILPSD